MKPRRRDLIEAELVGIVVLRRHARARGNVWADLPVPPTYDEAVITCHAGAGHSRVTAVCGNAGRLCESCANRLERILRRIPLDSPSVTH